MSHLQGVADDNSHNDAIDGHCLTKYDANEVLCTDPRCLYSCTNYA